MLVTLLDRQKVEVQACRAICKLVVDRLAGVEAHVVT